MKKIFISIPIVALVIPSCAPLPLEPNMEGRTGTLSAEENVLIGTWATSESIKRNRINSIYHFDSSGGGMRRDRYDGKFYSKPLSWRINGSVLQVDQGSGGMFDGWEVTANGGNRYNRYNNYNHSIPGGFFNYSVRFPGDEDLMILKDVKNPSRNLTLRRLSKTARMKAVEAFAKYDTR